MEEAQSKLEENEAARKRLQGRLESLSRQMEEGQGDRERLVEQLEDLRGQVRGSFATLETRRKLSGTVTRDIKNWPIADRRVPSNDPKSLCES